MNTKGIYCLNQRHFCFACETLFIFITAPSDNITDIHSLSMYLKDQEEKEYKASLSKLLQCSEFWYACLLILLFVVFFTYKGSYMSGHFI